MKFDYTGIILAGGKNSRFPGEKKTFRKLGNLMILEGIYRLLKSLFREIIVVVNEPQEFAGWDMTIATDIIPLKCALAGLHAGLFYASYPYAYVIAGDTPFVKQSIIKYIVDRIDLKYDVIIPRTHDGLEPLSAVYSKNCIPLIENNLEKNIVVIKEFFQKKRVREIPAKELEKLDPEMRFSFNINTPDDFEKAKKIADMTRHKIFI